MPITLEQRKQGWIPANTFGNRLRLLRHDLGMSVYELAELTNGEVSHASLSNWERGGRPQKAERAIKTIADATGVSETWLLTGSTDAEAAAAPGALGQNLKNPKRGAGARPKRSRPQQLQRPRSVAV